MNLFNNIDFLFTHRRHHSYSREQFLHEIKAETLPATCYLLPYPSCTDSTVAGPSLSSSTSRPERGPAYGKMSHVSVIHEKHENVFLTALRGKTRTAGPCRLPEGSGNIWPPRPKHSLVPWTVLFPGYQPQHPKVSKLRTEALGLLSRLRLVLDQQLPGV